RLAEAEPLMRRALAIDEQSYGPEHPSVARDLNNLALLLQAINRFEEAEPLMRRCLCIFLEFTQRHHNSHPNLHAATCHYGDLLKQMGLSHEQVEVKLRKLGQEYGLEY
ncbi:MAG: tetratricopeptide repeat protein, partial [Planctomycetaceae bacterium]|nr:tetratricopeptide repeat protein [Planctomycetaceae bacterium]